MGAQSVILSEYSPTTGNRLPVDGSAVTQPVSVASLPLPAGAALAIRQPAFAVAGKPSADVLTIQGAANGTPIPISGSISATIAGTLSALVTNTLNATITGTVIASVTNTITASVTNTLNATITGPVAATVTGTTITNTVAMTQSLTQTLKSKAFALGQTTAVVVAVPGKRIKVYAVKLVVSAALSVNWRDGATGVDIEGAQALSINGGFVESVNPPAFLFGTTAGLGLDLVVTGIGTAAGRVSYFEEDA